MLNAEAKQFKLTDDGQILFQKDASNPLPGELVVGRISKGDAILRPFVQVVDEAVPADIEKEALATKLQQWLMGHIATVLEPLLPLVVEDGMNDAAKEISAKLFNAMGIVLREDLEPLIAKLDDTGRSALRLRKVRLGPILVFLPALNKPAAIRLRALLWALWNDQGLPASVPNDGVTSVSVKDQTVDPVYYRAIGYPVYGPRAIRVDMLDRLIVSVYDSAKSGKFQVQHKMAEWLGCSVPDLYEVLEAMGHKKIHDPADDKPAEVETKTEETKTEETKTEETKTEETKVEEEAGAEKVAEKADETAPVEEVKEVTEGKTEEKPVEKSEEKTESVRPDLATFKLRRGKAYGSKRPPRRNKTSGDKKPFDKKQSGKPFKKRKGGKHDRDNRRDRPERVISAKAPPSNPEDSPFAILQQLKVQSGQKD